MHGLVQAQRMHAGPPPHGLTRAQLRNTSEVFAFVHHAVLYELTGLVLTQLMHASLVIAFVPPHVFPVISAVTCQRMAFTLIW